MRTFKHSAIQLGLTALFSLAALAVPGTAAALPIGWTCEGTCGKLGANGVVTESPAGGNYVYVTTNGEPNQTGLGLGTEATGSETNGTVLRFIMFSASAGDTLEYYFNFVTSDGDFFSDYAWSRLLDSTLTEVALLFTARTTRAVNTVLGFGMGDIAAIITPIIPGGLTWSPLGDWSGECWRSGCGYTGWLQSSYSILVAGNYFLEFGVVNWLDTRYDTGMAIDGILVGGRPINPVPVPATIVLIGLGLAGPSLSRRKKA